MTRRAVALKEVAGQRREPNAMHRRFGSRRWRARSFSATALRVMAAIRSVKSGPTRESGHTSPGEILGTIGYMAPEQIDHSHAKVGPRTDVYALGTLLYEMLTGAPPFASNPALTLRQVLQDDAPMPTRVRPGVPRDVEAICLKCLEKDVADRYASADAI